MKSTSQGTVRWRIRSAMKTTAPFSTPTGQVAALVVAADLGPELGDPALEVLGRDEGLADLRDRSGATPPRRRLLGQAGAEHRHLAGPLGQPELLGHGDAGHPGDLALRPRRRAGCGGASGAPAVGEQVLERLRARRGRAGACGPRRSRPHDDVLAERRRRRASPVRGRPARPAAAGARLEPASCPKRHSPGTVSVAGSSSASSARSEKLTKPPSQTARRPPPRSTSPPSEDRARRRISAARSRPSATSRRAARSASARSARRARAPARAGERVGGDRGDARRRRPRRSSSSPTTRSSTSASSASSARVSAMLRSAAELSSRSTGSTSARIRLRANAGSSFVGSSANGSPAAAAIRRVSARPSASSGRTTRPRRGRQAEQGAAPRRDREPVEHGLGDVGAGVPGRDPVGAAPGAEALGGRVAGVAGRAPGGSPRRASGRSTIRARSRAARRARARRLRRGRRCRAARSSGTARRAL